MLLALTITPAGTYEDQALIASGFRGLAGLLSLEDPAETARVERDEIRAEMTEAGIL